MLPMQIKVIHDIDQAPLLINYQQHQNYGVLKKKPNSEMLVHKYK